MIRSASCIVLACALAMPAAAQMRRDPLNDKEVEQLRDAAQDPKKRIDLFLTYARARLSMAEHLRADPKMGTDQADKIGELLEDFAGLIDEVDDNLSMYNERSEDLRRALRRVIQANSDFQVRLRAIKETAKPEQLHLYSTALESAIDSVNTSSDSAHLMLTDQLAKKGEEKDKDKLDKEDAKAAAKADKPDKSPVPDASQQRPDYTGMGGIGRQPQGPR